MRVIRIGHFVHPLLFKNCYLRSAIALFRAIAHPVGGLINLLAPVVGKPPVEQFRDHFAFDRIVNEPNRTNRTPVVRV